MMEFKYFEVRACIETDGEITSYRKTNEFEDEPLPSGYMEAIHQLVENGKSFKTFWTLFGIVVYEDKLSGGSAHEVKIGEFQSEEWALEIMNAILAPMAKVRDAILNVEDKLHEPIYEVCMELDDFINQCSNSDRT